MGRLIDADVLKTREILDALRSADFDDEIEAVIDNIPTAYDVEAKVAELEKVSFERFGNDGMGGQRVVSLDDVIEIVRGKE